LTSVSEVFTASIIITLMMEAISIFEMLVSFYNTTWHSILEDSSLQYEVGLMKLNNARPVLLSLSVSNLLSVEQDVLL
jgi:hypothetical protein